MGIETEIGKNFAKVIISVLMDTAHPVLVSPLLCLHMCDELDYIYEYA